QTLAKMSLMNTRFGDKSYQLVDYLKDVQNKIWAELINGGKIDNYRQSVQNSYLEKMAKLIMPATASPLEILKGLPMIGSVVSELIPNNDNGVVKALATVNAEQLKTQVEAA